MQVRRAAQRQYPLEARQEFAKLLVKRPLREGKHLKAVGQLRVGMDCPEGIDRADPHDRNLEVVAEKLERMEKHPLLCHAPGQDMVQFVENQQSYVQVTKDRAHLSQLLRCRMARAVRGIHGI